MLRIVCLALICAAFVLDGRVVAQDSSPRFVSPGDESEQFSTETILDGLKSPFGIAVRTGNSSGEKHELYLAESGAGRVIRVLTDKPKSFSEVITGFKQMGVSEEPKLQLGPMGLIFLTPSKLAVGGGGLQSSPGVLSVYVLSDEAGPIDAEDADHTVGPIHAGERDANSKRAFWGIAKTETAVFCTWGDREQGWILKSGLEANRLSYLQALLSPRENLELQVPGGITVTPSSRPSFLVVGSSGSYETPQDSQLAFYQMASGSLAMSLETGLHDISALAYSPSGQLYAADFAQSDEDSGGIYRLDDAYLNGQQACQAVKIATIARPTAMTFTSDGTLFVTALGESEESGDESSGVLVKVTGKL